MTIVKVVGVKHKGGDKVYFFKTGGRYLAIGDTVCVPGPVIPKLAKVVVAPTKCNADAMPRELKTILDVG